LPKLINTPKERNVNFVLRPGRPEDAPACGKICYEAFTAISERHNFPPDFPSAEVATGLMSMMLANSSVYSVVAESEGRILGSNFLWEGSIAGVGPITVDPVAQNSAIGRRLMQDVMEHCRKKKFPGVRLVQAAYHSRSLSLYAKLGFVVREPLATIQGPPIDERIPGYDVRRAEEQDLEVCNALCHKVHGHERSAELLDSIRQEAATVVVHNGRITAYATMLGFFGHAVAETNEDLKPNAV
jgi:predicted N-acetyltransferase YhbS